jgi:hypothetical protein
MMIVEEQMECELAGETEVLGENLPSVPLRSSRIPFGLPLEPGPSWWETSD